MNSVAARSEDFLEIPVLDLARADGGSAARARARGRSSPCRHRSRILLRRRPWRAAKRHRLTRLRSPSGSSPGRWSASRSSRSTSAIAAFSVSAGPKCRIEPKPDLKESFLFGDRFAAERPRCPRRQAADGSESMARRSARIERRGRAIFFSHSGLRQSASASVRARPRPAAGSFSAAVCQAASTRFIALLPAAAAGHGRRSVRRFGTHGLRRSHASFAKERSAACRFAIAPAIGSTRRRSRAASSSTSATLWRVGPTMCSFRPHTGS